jgi:hypothetical protein
VNINETPRKEELILSWHYGFTKQTDLSSHELRRRPHGAVWLVAPSNGQVEVRHCRRSAHTGGSRPPPDTDKVRSSDVTGTTPVRVFLVV